MKFLIWSFFFANVQIHVHNKLTLSVPCKKKKVVHSCNTNILEKDKKMLKHNYKFASWTENTYLDHFSTLFTSLDAQYMNLKK